MSINIPDSSPISGFYLDDGYYKHYPKGIKMTDYIPEELRPIVNNHWDQFPPTNPLIGHFFGIVLFFLWIISFLGNGCVIYIFLKVKSLRTSTNMFVVNLALSDLCMMTTQALPVSINVFLQRYWAWGVFGCKLYGFMGATFGTTSIITMVVIGYDRYNVIVKGFTGRKINAITAFFIIIFLWIYSSAISLPALFDVWGGYMAEGMLYTCSYDYLTDTFNHRSFVIFTIVFTYVVPLTFVFYFYSAIVKAVCIHEIALRKQAQKMNVETLRSNVNKGESAEMKIAKVAITNVSLWAAIWTPYAIVVFISSIGHQQLITPLISQLPAFFAKLASCLNPIVYAISHPKYRAALTQELPCLCVKESVDYQDTQTVKETINSDKA